jgi:hypothetical protein
MRMILQKVELLIIFFCNTASPMLMSLTSHNLKKNKMEVQYKDHTYSIIASISYNIWKPYITVQYLVKLQEKKKIGRSTGSA